MRSPLTETIYKVQEMITYVRDNLSTDEYMLFLDLLVPEPEVVRSVKKKPAAQSRKIDHCAACNYTNRAAVHKDASVSGYHQFQSSKGKSARAAGIAATLNKNLSAQRNSALDDTTSESVMPADDWRTPCAKEGCELTADSAIHDVTSGYLGAHPFVPPSSAPGAAQPSSASNGEGSTTPSSEDGTVSAQGAAGGSNERK